MASAEPTHAKAQAKAAIERAMSGELARGGEYPVSYNGSYRSVLPPTFFKNVSTSPGETGTMYMDFQNECLVIHYGGE